MAYEQGEAETARKYGGIGLGLSICRQIAELMGGSVDLESDLGKSRTFQVSAPFTASENTDL